MKSLVLLFPGQGSQYVGMGKAFFDAHASVRTLFAEASEILGIDVARLCFEGPEPTLVQTENVQPAITLVNLASLQVLREYGVSPLATAGHSLGEYAALCAAGVFSFADTMRLVRVRGMAMQEAAERSPGGMVSVVGLTADKLESVCAEAADVGSVEVANHNSESQVALTGEKEALVRASALAKAAGAKLVTPLKVSGPWHSRFMADAQRPLRDALDDCSVHAPTVPVIANVTGAPYEAGQVRELLVRQLVSPVRWTDSMAWLLAAGHRTFLEAGPGKVLTGLFRYIDKSATARNVQDPETLAGALAAIA